MKRTALALMLIALAASCNTEPKTAVQKKVDSYALVKIERQTFPVSQTTVKKSSTSTNSPPTRQTVSTGSSILVTRP